MLKKIYRNKHSFEGQIVIEENKIEFQSVVLLPINLYLKDNFYYIYIYLFKSDMVLVFFRSAGICSRELDLETVNCFCIVKIYIGYKIFEIFGIIYSLVEITISHLYFLVCCSYIVST